MTSTLTSNDSVEAPTPASLLNIPIKANEQLVDSVNPSILTAVSNNNNNNTNIINANIKSAKSNLMASKDATNNKDANKDTFFTLKKWNLVAMWSWDVECEVCAICRTPLMG